MSSIAGQESVSCSLFRLDMPSSVGSSRTRVPKAQPGSTSQPTQPLYTHACTHLLAGCSSEIKV